MKDLTSIAPKSRRVPLLHPSNEQEVGLTFLLRSPHSEEVQKAQRAFQNKRLSKRKSMTAESFEAGRLQIIVAAVEGWEFTDTDLTIHGEQPEYSTQALKDLLKDPALLWIREFLDRELGDEGSFFDD